MTMKLVTAVSATALLAMAGFAPAFASDDPESNADLEARIAELEATNEMLIGILRAQGLIPAEGQQAATPHAQAPTPANQPAAIAAQGQGVQQTQMARHSGHGMRDHHGSGGYVGISSDYSFRILDHAEGVNTRQLTQLQAMQSGELNNRVTLSGGITALANYQESNSNSKFGWLMRHPTSNNQIGETVSEFVVHSAQLAVTARVTDNITTFAEILYDPEQSFGAGTITALTRNQVQLRRGWVMFGNLDERPVYAAIGKMDTPFGLNDTVSPFTNSTNWHAFSGLAYGGLVGYYNNGLHLRAMAIQGGAQFRAHNSPVEDTAVPSRVNNWALDARYSGDLGADGEFLIGASYTHATAYCQPYPVFHFTPCSDNNPAWAVYSEARFGDFEVLGEYAVTTEEWPGSASPFPQFAAFDAVETEAFSLGGRWWMDIQNEDDFALSLEFSRFIAGDDGAPWEKQDQLVLGGSYFILPNVNLFGEYIRTEGWVPLNFLSGGNLDGGATHSESDAVTNILTFGVQTTF